MAKYYCYFGDKVKGPISCKTIQGALCRGEITEDMMVRSENADEWTPLRDVLESMKWAEKEDRKKEISQSCNETADNLLTASFVVFICAAILQFIAGLVLCSEVSLEIGLPLIISSPCYIFPIAVSYVLRQMFRHQLRN